MFCFLPLSKGEVSVYSASHTVFLVITILRRLNGFRALELGLSNSLVKTLQVNLNKTQPKYRDLLSKKHSTFNGPKISGL